MDELTLDGETYVSSKRAAKITGYAKDYVGQLCREGRVKAQLVGRNWYILEDSIRQHRFGTPESANAAPAAVVESPVSTWEKPQYASEAISELPMVEKAPIYAAQDLTADPIVTEASQINVPEATVQATEPELPKKDTSELVKEMQTAWQDWFRQKNEEKVVEEVTEELLLDVPDAAEVSAKPVFDAETTPIALERVPAAQKEDLEEEDQDSITIPIHRSYAVPQKEMPVVEAKAIEEVRTFSHRQTIEELRRSRKANRVIIRENSSGSNVALKALILAIMLIAVAVTIISSGYFDSYFSRDSLTYFPLQYLGGERVINK